MLAIRNLFRVNPHLIQNAVHKRNMSAIAVPPRTKISRGELIFLTSMMVSSWLFIPTWVLVNMKNYRSKE